MSLCIATSSLSTSPSVALMTIPPYTASEVGKLDELVLDPTRGDITHLQMREGHLWGKKDVAIPVSEVQFVDRDTIYLKLDKNAVKALSAVPVRRETG